jgi:hypothetical protein
MWLEKDMKEISLKTLFDNISHLGASATVMVLGWSIFKPHTTPAIFLGGYVLLLGLALGFMSLVESMIISIKFILESDQRAQKVFAEKHSTYFFLKEFPFHFIGSGVFSAATVFAMAGLIAKIASIAKA